MTWSLVLLPMVTKAHLFKNLARGEKDKILTKGANSLINWKTSNL